MRRHDFDLDGILNDWAKQHRLSEPDAKAVRDAIVTAANVDPWSIYSWWHDLARMVVQSATAPLSLRWNGMSPLVWTGCGE